MDQLALATHDHSGIASSGESHLAPSESFDERLVAAFNEAGMLLMVSVGHRTGLFEAMRDGRQVTAAELAALAGGLEERYVREWLGALVASRVVELEPGTQRYHLPVEHALWLASGGPANLAVFAQYVPVLGAVEDDIVECFQRGGGVAYARYARFHEVMAEDSAQTVLAALFDAILPLAPELPARLESGIAVMDAGCGRGRALLAMAERYPASRFVGYDLSQQAIDWAREAATGAGLANIEFVQRDLSDFAASAEQASFDLVTTFDAIHDQADPLSLLTGIRRSLKPNGVYLAQDIRSSGNHHDDRDHPLGAFLYAVSCMHCTPVSLAQGGQGLGAMWGRPLAAGYLARAGFDHVERHELEHDIQNDFYICRTG
jgi:SAM-dependent methyltransferase